MKLRRIVIKRTVIRIFSARSVEDLYCREELQSEIRDETKGCVESLGVRDEKGSKIDSVYVSRILKVIVEIRDEKMS